MNRIEEAVAELEEILHSKHGNAIDKMGRGGKGELFILNYLCGRDAPVLPSEISDAMHSSTARISAALNSLEKKGQIHREIDKTNRRNILVTVTDKGQERSCSTKKHMREQMVDILAEMGEQDAVELVRLAKRFFEISHQVFDGDPPDI